MLYESEFNLLTRCCPGSTAACAVACLSELEAAGTDLEQVKAELAQSAKVIAEKNSELEQMRAELAAAAKAAAEGVPPQQPTMTCWIAPQAADLVFATCHPL